MNFPVLKPLLMFLLLPLAVNGQTGKPCDKAHVHYRNLESQAIKKVVP